MTSVDPQGTKSSPDVLEIGAGSRRAACKTRIMISCSKFIPNYPPSQVIKIFLNLQVLKQICLPYSPLPKISGDTFDLYEKESLKRRDWHSWVW